MQKFWADWCQESDGTALAQRHRALIEPAGGLGGTSGMGVGLSRQRTANVSEASTAQTSQASELKVVIPRHSSTAHAPPPPLACSRKRAVTRVYEGSGSQPGE